MSLATDGRLRELREQLVAAHHSSTPMRLRGAGTKDFYGERLHGELLELGGYAGIVDYEPSELVLSARCGTRLSELEQTLAARRQFLGFEPPAFDGDPTLGGIIAAGLSGPRRMYAGAVRDFVLGAALLATDGELLRFGGRVMKNVAGFDVARLLCGSMGILGPIVEISIKVLPQPRLEATLRFEMSAQQAIETFNLWAGQPLPISAAAWCGGRAWLRLSGAVPAVRSAQQRLGGETVDPTTAHAWWSGVRDLQLPLFHSAAIWRLSVPSITPSLALPGELLIDWGGALRWYAGDTGDVDVRDVAVAAGGTALRWRGPAPNGRFHPLPPSLSAIHRRLKQHFDPRGIFNPGRLVPDL